MKTQYLMLCASVLFCSCRAIKPKAPTLSATPIAVEPLPPSVINLPVSVDLKSVLNTMETKLPMVFEGESEAKFTQYRWNIQRGALQSDFTDDSLNVSNVAHCRVEGYVKNPLSGNYNKIVACDLNVRIGLKGQFTVSHNYTLQGNIRLADFDMCNCDQLGRVNIISLVKPRAVRELNTAVSNLNKSINQYNIRSLLQPGWDALCKPMKINDVGYLQINPVAINMGTPVRNQNVLHVPVVVTAKPVFSLEKPEQGAVPLPEMSGASGNGYTINLDAHLHYKPLNKMIAENLKEEQTPIGPHSYFIIKSAEIFGEGNKHMLIKVKFSGKYGIVPYHGILYFTCLPQFDPKTTNLDINDIDFDAHTADKLRGSWLLTPIVKKHVGRQIHFNIASQLTTLKSELVKGLNRDLSNNVRLNGSVSSLSLQDILPMNDYLLVRVVAKGNMAVNVH